MWIAITHGVLELCTCGLTYLVNHQQSHNRDPFLVLQPVPRDDWKPSSAHLLSSVNEETGGN